MQGKAWLLAHSHGHGEPSGCKGLQIVAKAGFARVDTWPGIQHQRKQEAGRERQLRVPSDLRDLSQPVLGIGCLQEGNLFTVARNLSLAGKEEKQPFFSDSMSGGTAPVHHEIPVSDLHLMIPPYRCEDVRPAKHNKAWEPEERGQIFALPPPLGVTLGNSLSPFVSFSLDSKVGLREAPLFL